MNAEETFFSSNLCVSDWINVPCKNDGVDFYKQIHLSELGNLQYRKLQKVASMLHLPGNAKRKQLLGLIVARKRGRENIVDAITDEIMQERRVKREKKATEKHLNDSNTEENNNIIQEFSSSHDSFIGQNVCESRNQTLNQDNNQHHYKNSYTNPTPQNSLENISLELDSQELFSNFYNLHNKNVFHNNNVEFETQELDYSNSADNSLLTTDSSTRTSSTIDVISISDIETMKDKKVEVKDEPELESQNPEVTRRRSSRVSNSVNYYLLENIDLCTSSPSPEKELHFFRGPAKKKRLVSKTPARKAKSTKGRTRRTSKNNNTIATEAPIKIEEENIDYNVSSPSMIYSSTTNSHTVIPMINPNSIKSEKSFWNEYHGSTNINLDSNVSSITPENDHQTYQSNGKTDANTNNYLYAPIPGSIDSILVPDFNNDHRTYQANVNKTEANNNNLYAPIPGSIDSILLPDFNSYHRSYKKAINYWNIPRPKPAVNFPDTIQAKILSLDKSNVSLQNTSSTSAFKKFDPPQESDFPNLMETASGGEQLKVSPYQSSSQENTTVTATTTTVTTTTESTTENANISAPNISFDSLLSSQTEQYINEIVTKVLVSPSYNISIPPIINNNPIATGSETKTKIQEQYELCMGLAYDYINSHPVNPIKSEDLMSAVELFYHQNQGSVRESTYIQASFGINFDETSGSLSTPISPLMGNTNFDKMPYHFFMKTFTKQHFFYKTEVSSSVYTKSVSLLRNINLSIHQINSKLHKSLPHSVMPELKIGMTESLNLQQFFNNLPDDFTKSLMELYDECEKCSNLEDIASTSYLDNVISEMEDGTYLLDGHSTTNLDIHRPYIIVPPISANSSVDRVAGLSEFEKPMLIVPPFIIPINNQINSTSSLSTNTEVTNSIKEISHPAEVETSYQFKTCAYNSNNTQVFIPTNFLLQPKTEFSTAIPNLYLRSSNDFVTKQDHQLVNQFDTFNANVPNSAPISYGINLPIENINPVITTTAENENSVTTKQVGNSNPGPSYTFTTLNSDLTKRRKNEALQLQRSNDISNLQSTLRNVTIEEQQVILNSMGGDITSTASEVYNNINTQQHMDQCSKLHSLCPYFESTCCQWKACFAQLPIHLRTFHRDKIVNRKAAEYIVNYKPLIFKGIKIIQEFYGRMFSISCCPFDGRIFITVQVFCENIQQHSERPTATLMFKHNSGNMQWQGEAHSVTITVSELWKPGACISIPIKVLSSYPSDFFRLCCELGADIY